MNDLGRTLLLAGLVLAAVGALLLVVGRIPGLGRLPGDLSFRWHGVQIYIPLASCLLVSLVASFLLALFRR